MVVVEQDSVGRVRHATPSWEPRQAGSVREDSWARVEIPNDWVRLRPIVWLRDHLDAHTDIPVFCNVRHVDI